MTPAAIQAALAAQMTSEDVDPAEVDHLTAAILANAREGVWTRAEAAALLEVLQALEARVREDMRAIDAELGRSQSRMRAVRGYGDRPGRTALTRGQRVMKRV